MDEQNTRYEEYSVQGTDLLSKVKEVIHQGNVRRVYIKNSDGDTLLEIPLTAGVGITAVTALVAPALIAVGALAAVLTKVTVGVESTVDEDTGPAASPPQSGQSRSE